MISWDSLRKINEFADESSEIHELDNEAVIHCYHGDSYISNVQ